MPQDEKTREAYEHTDKMQKQERQEAQEDQDLNEAILHADQHTGQFGVMPPDEAALEGDEVKEVYDLLSGWRKDELRRLRLVPSGARLGTGDAYFDLRDPVRGELVATGEETVSNELLVAKRDVDYEIWNKLLGKQTPGG